MFELRRLAGAVLLSGAATLGGCGGSGSAAPEPVAPLGQAAPSSAWLDRELASCRQMLAGGMAPAVAEEPLVRGLCFEAFAVMHEGATRTPKLVLRAIDRASITAAQAVPRVDNFYDEARLPAAERSTLADYRGSGHDRRHMAPAADMPSVTASVQSFSPSNVVPQVPSHSAGAWAKIEADTRSYALRASGTVYVATGSVFTPVGATVGGGWVAVPVVLFKLVHDSASGRSWGHWQANAAGTTANEPITKPELVQRLGYDPMPGGVSAAVASGPNPWHMANLRTRVGTCRQRVCGL